MDEIKNEKELILGRNPVMEAIKNNETISKIVTLKGGQGSVKKIIGLAKDNNIMIQYADRVAMDRMCDGQNHQGIIAVASAFEYCEVEDILEKAKEKGQEPFIVILDGIEDPHNLGAIIRTAEIAGVHGIIIPKRRACEVTETVIRASAGAVEYMMVAKTSNIVQSMEKLKKQGVWIAACDMGGEPYYQGNMTGGFALVVGGEGKGVSRLVREKCDFALTIPMQGQINSLNASNAAAVILTEAMLQRFEGLKPRRK